MSEDLLNKKQRIIIIIVIVFLLILTFFSLTYAYFLTKIKGNENDKSIIVTTANLILEYGDGNGIIELYKVEPGITFNKTFTVTNKGNTTIKDYAVVLENVINNFYNRTDLTYSLSCVSVDKDTQEIKGSCEGKSEISFPRSEEIMVTNDIDIGIMHKYVLSVNYKETNLDQSIDMNKNMSAKVNIYDRRDKIVYLTDDTATEIFLDNIDRMETLAKEFISSKSLSVSSTWLVFSTISKLGYDTTSWSIVAGDRNTDFEDYLVRNNFDINVFKNMKYLASPNEYSGVVHFSAALAAMLYNTDPLYNFIMDEEHYNNLAGWAGDLQTLISNNLLKEVSNQNDYNEVYQKMSNLIGKNGTYFDSDDLYADLDAINLYYLLSSSSNSSIKTVLELYFNGKYQQRFSTFVKRIAGTYDYETLKQKIFIYTQYKNGGTTWPLFKDISEFSSTVAEASRDSVTDYIWYLSNLRALNIFTENIVFKKGTTVNFSAEYVDSNDKTDVSLTNEDYTWLVTNVDGSSCLSTIDNGVLSIASNEINNQLQIKIILNKSNKVVATREINLT